MLSRMTRYVCCAVKSAICALLSGVQAIQLPSQQGDGPEEKVAAVEHAATEIDGTNAAQPEAVREPPDLFSYLMALFPARDD